MNNFNEILEFVRLGQLITTEQKKQIESFCRYIRIADPNFNILFFGNTHARITTDEKYILEFHEIQTPTKHS
jgi:hypothetical protein